MSDKAGIYVSFPFCRQKCTYCNFASGAFPEGLVEPYLEALAEEIRGSESLTAGADTLYLGGGTPSLLEVGQLERIIGALGDRNWLEATIEASPGTVTAQKAAGWARLGINRASLGVQSFVPKEVRTTGRRHTPEDVAHEIEILRSCGIDAINVDLIAGLAHQTQESWNESLEWVRRLQPPHVSVYMLEVDDESRLGEELRSGGNRYGASHVPSDEEITDFYLQATDKLRQMPIKQYEISNFAKPGYESKHNLKYWNMQIYVGFGADAHSFDGVRRWSNVEGVTEYLERYGRGEPFHLVKEQMQQDRLTEDRLITGLRQTSGIIALESELRRFEEQLSRLEARCWIEKTADGRLRLTPEGVLFSNEIFQTFLEA